MFHELVCLAANDTLKFFALAQIKYHEVVLYLHCVLFGIAKKIQRLDILFYFHKLRIYFVITKTICSTVELRLQTSLSISDAAQRLEQYFPKKFNYIERFQGF